MKFNIQRKEQSNISNVDFDNIPFGRVFADHMVIINYENGAWQTPSIQPFGELSLSPTLSCMHYGQAIFEGMKAYRGANNKILLFRPEDNANRLQESAKRMCMPELPVATFMEALNQWLKLDHEWVPNNASGSLYIRPFMIATDDYLGVKPSEKYKFILYGCPVNAYYNEPLRIKIEEFFSRASSGGVGAAKTAGNYAAAMYPASLAQAEGYHQLLWTDSNEHQYIEELGTSNFFALIGDTLVTPALHGTILNGITRDTVIKQAKDFGVIVEERPFKVTELVEAAANGNLKECFATGTAATIAKIQRIGFRDEVFDIEIKEDSLSNKLNIHLDQLRRGKVDDPHHWRYAVEI